ncbi:alcohol dehydrogenase catalytic domain-containing protein [Sphingomonas paucimobilis]|uniref:Alcohol dehydrogenase catalytic domain-containing protein n=1 Tax=Sphingomonas paucimobilis TaxID=13689 RepID=A0A7T3E7P5_SPHPI|nr:alcohol dehydrogenase catalytic domain-containing protein [Sphingomonas sp.]QPS18357.1 alcohol dehydrogenase catalytic domain-containing protein [Sphingomonas paucimobilis]QPT10649.1 alcohol dehydrogenase catalytic domain-containing protein [Sphingomonas paucimobilis]QRY97783.1 alcohol dehydrogenase catalytic domain-containing protein [Sphingomonas paucimobilis]
MIGHEGVGVVEALGDLVCGSKVGDRVVISTHGPQPYFLWSRRALCPMRQSGCLKVGLEPAV